MLAKIKHPGKSRGYHYQLIPVSTVVSFKRKSRDNERNGQEDIVTHYGRVCQATLAELLKCLRCSPPAPTEHHICLRLFVFSCRIAHQPSPCLRESGSVGVRVVLVQDKKCMDSCPGCDLRAVTVDDVITFVMATLSCGPWTSKDFKDLAVYRF